MKLNDRQQLFCLEYTVDLNATQAALRAGYSKKTAAYIGSENLKKPHISQQVMKLLAERNNKVKVNSEYVLNRLVEIDTLDVIDIIDDNGDMLPITKWSKAWRTSVSGIDINKIIAKETDIETIIKKVKFPDKLRNLELLGRHVDVRAWDKESQPTAIEPVRINIVRAKKPE